MNRSQARWGGLALVLGLSGCRFGEMASHNLDVVMSSDDRLRYVGDVQGPLEYLLTGFIDPALVQSDSLLAGGEDPIPDPTDVAIENLLDLARSSDGPRSWREVEEVRQFARYAVACPSGLARERALLELAPHGVRLALSEPWSPSAAPASAAEIRSRLEGLVDGARSLLAQGRTAGETAEADFRAACEVLGEAEVDIEGGRRVLRAISPFLRQSALGTGPRAALVDLSNRVQRRVVTEALARGLRDPLDYVRAAAVRANARVYGEPYLMEAALMSATVPTFLQLPQSLRERWRRFGLEPDPVDEEEARIAVYEELAARGMPAAAVAEDGVSLANRIGLLLPLVQVAVNHTIFPGRVRVHAMVTLEELTGTGPGSLREEDWAAWWSVEGPRLQRLQQARSAAEAAAARGEEPVGTPPGGPGGAGGSGDR